MFVALLALGFAHIKHVPPVPPQVHFVVSLAKIRSIFIAPQGAKPPPGLTDLGPVAHAVVTYPDGSTQVADANGVFSPLVASYAIKNDAILELNPDAQPAVKVQDPAGTALSSSTTISGYADASLGAPLAGVRSVPAGSELFSGDRVLLSAEATDSADHAASLAGASLSWSATAGTIEPIAGTATALYIAPNASEPILDMVRVRVVVPGEAMTLSSTSAIETLPRSVGFTYHGTLLSSANRPLPGAAALFTAQGTSRVFGSYNFFALADGHGVYSALVPTDVDLLASIGTTAANAPNGVADFFLVDSELSAGSPGGNALQNLSLAGSDEFDDGKEDASHAIDPPIGSVRDALFGTEFITPGPWAADSGLFALLANVPKTFPSPAAPAALSRGLFVDWCYQWVLRGGVPQLVLVENAAGSCTAPGVQAYAISPAASGFAFERYATTAGRYALATPLDPTQGGSARLIAAGTWRQAATGPVSAPVSDVARVRVDAYGPVAPAFGAPENSETFRYRYAANGGLASTRIDEDALVDTASGQTIQTATIAARQLAPLDTTGCVGTAQPAACYAFSGAVYRYAYTSAGRVTREYAALGTLFGDGSEARSFADTKTSAHAKVTVPIASRARRAAAGCLVCAPATGSLVDVDGITQLGTFTVDADRVVSLTLLDTEPDDPPGGPIAVIGFGF